MSMMAHSIFIVLALWTLAVDRKRRREAKKAARVVYAVIYVLACGLFVSRVVGIPVPMPTRILASTIGSWVRSLLPL